MQKRILSVVTALSAVLLLTACSPSSKTQTVNGTGTGKHGEIKVAVTFKGNKIEKVKVLKEQENKVLSKPVYHQLKDTIVAKNSTDVDVISGSTATSKGYIAAINAAVKKAGITLKSTKKKATSTEPKVGKTNNYDVVVVGSGGGGFSAAIEAKKLASKWRLLKRCQPLAGIP